MKVGFNKGRRTSWDVRCRISCRIRGRRLVVVKNGQIEEASVTSTRGQCTDPCPGEIQREGYATIKWLTIVVGSLVGFKLESNVNDSPWLNGTTIDLRRRSSVGLLTVYVSNKKIIRQ